MLRRSQAAACMFVLADCWSAPSGPDADGGAQVSADDVLRFWLGAPCDGVTTVRVALGTSTTGRSASGG